MPKILGEVCLGGICRAGDFSNWFAAITAFPHSETRDLGVEPTICFEAIIPTI